MSIACVYWLITFSLLLWLSKATRQIKPLLLPVSIWGFGLWYCALKISCYSLDAWIWELTLSLLIWEFGLLLCVALLHLLLIYFILFFCPLMRCCRPKIQSCIIFENIPLHIILAHIHKIILKAYRHVDKMDNSPFQIQNFRCADALLCCSIIAVPPHMHTHS